MENKKYYMAIVDYDQNSAVIITTPFSKSEIAKSITRHVFEWPVKSTKADLKRNADYLFSGLEYFSVAEVTRLAPDTQDVNGHYFYSDSIDGLKDQLNRCFYYRPSDIKPIYLSI